MTFSYPYRRDLVTKLTSATPDDGFADWLNEIDARIDYDVRKQISLTEWRHLFDFSYSVKDACLMALTGRVR